MEQAAIKKSNDREIKETQKMGLPGRLSFFRKHENLTLRQLSDDSGIDLTMISRMEKGERPIPIDFLTFLGSKYKMSYSWFFTGAGARKTQGEEKTNIITDIAKIFEMEHALKKAVESHQKLIFQLLEENKKLSADINEIKIKLQNR